MHKQEKLVENDSTNLNQAEPETRDLVSTGWKEKNQLPEGALGPGSVD